MNDQHWCFESYYLSYQLFLCFAPERSVHLQRRITKKFPQGRGRTCLECLEQHADIANYLHNHIKIFRAFCQTPCDATLLQTFDLIRVSIDISGSLISRAMARKEYDALNTATVSRLDGLVRADDQFHCND